MKRIKWGLLGLLGLAGCFKDKLEVPAYIYVGGIGLEIQDPSVEGSGSANIQDGWITVDGQLIGVNNLPMRLPVLLNDSLDEHTVRVGAGILDNGIANTRAMYPFYTRYEVVRDLEAGQTDTLYPVVRYDPNCTIRLVEDFEGPGVNFGYDIDQDTLTTMVKTQVYPFEGFSAGKLIFNPATKVSAVATGAYSNLQGASTSFPVYVEMNYKTNLAMEVGIVGFSGGIPTQVSYIGGVNPSNDWKKIYFNFTTTVFGMQMPQYALTFRAIKNDTIPEPEVYVDNIKILHY